MSSVLMHDIHTICMNVQAGISGPAKGLDPEKAKEVLAKAQVGGMGYMVWDWRGEADAIEKMLVG
jgi:hypothetical protein